MTYSPLPITEDDLHGYIDHALDPTRRAAVEDYLDAHPDVAARTVAYESQRDALRSVLRPIAEEPIPPQLNLRHIAERRRWAWGLPGRSMVAAVLLLAVGGAGGWGLRGAVVPLSEVNGIAALAQEAAYTYGTYGSDPTRPVEFDATDKAQLVSWISGRLGQTISIPDLAASGYRFMGGRLVATPNGPAGMLMYDNGSGQHLAVLVRPMKIDKDTRMSNHAFGDVRGFAWSSKGMGFSVVATAPADLLHLIADEVRRQEERI
jgi:anti-sigma factor RsiW